MRSPCCSQIRPGWACLGHRPTSSRMCLPRRAPLPLCLRGEGTDSISGQRSARFLRHRCDENQPTGFRMVSSGGAGHLSREFEEPWAENGTAVEDDTRPRARPESGLCDAGDIDIDDCSDTHRNIALTHSHHDLRKNPHRGVQSPDSGRARGLVSFHRSPFPAQAPRIRERDGRQPDEDHRSPIAGFRRHL